MKDNLFSKIVKRDYNNHLEEVLSHKGFSMDVKNTLLSMFYKIENGYKDYNEVKRETFEKQEYIEKLITIIDKDCDTIEFVRDERQEIVDKDKKEIKCFPMETKILYGLAKIQKRNAVVKYLDKYIEDAFTFFINIGNNINMVEPLRDFNGFSWNTIVKDIEDLNLNIMYQNMIFLMGNQFVDKWVNNYEPLVDYFDLFQANIEKKYGKKARENIITNMIRLSIMIKSSYDELFKKDVEQEREKLEELKYEMENREKYLVKASKLKKQKEKEIKILDKTMNDKKLLIEEYEERNENLPLNKKIFSIRVLKNNLKEERKSLLEDINRLNQEMQPSNFLKRKKQIEEELKYLAIPEEDRYQDEIQNSLISLQKEIIKCMNKKVKNVENKNELIEMIYIYRYYNLIPVDNEKCIYQIKELKKYLEKLTKMLIDKAIEMKVINQIFDDEKINYEIISKLLLSKIITLEDINLKLSIGKDKMVLTIFDEEIEDEKIKLENVSKEKIKIKNNKKIKLLI